jgi:UPF0755 protein
MKWFLITFVSLVLVAVISAAGGFLWWTQSISAPGNSSEVKNFVITKGSPATKIANDLKTQGLIKNPLAFRIYVRMNNLSSKLPTGAFEIPSNLTLAQVVNKILAGPTQIWVTIPEGLRREEVARRFVEGLEIPEAKQMDFFSEFLAASTGQEGRLFPSTYLFPREITATKVVNKLTQTFNQKFPDADNQTVVLASLLERETLTKAERPVVAGILFNRLEEGWNLQIDATVQYALANEQCEGKEFTCDFWPRPLTIFDIQNTDSPFNTYKYTGVPPSPIANPGETSMKAIMNPEDSDYMFYIHDNSGQIHYAKTLDEHNQNVQTYLR